MVREARAPVDVVLNTIGGALAVSLCGRYSNNITCNGWGTVM